MFKILRNDLRIETADSACSLSDMLSKMENMMVKPTSWAAEGNRLLKMEMKPNETCTDYIARVHRQVEMTTLPWNQEKPIEDIIKILITRRLHMRPALQKEVAINTGDMGDKVFRDMSLEEITAKVINIERDQDKKDTVGVGAMRKRPNTRRSAKFAAISTCLRPAPTFVD